MGIKMMLGDLELGQTACEKRDFWIMLWIKFYAYRLYTCTITKLFSIPFLIYTQVRTILDVPFLNLKEKYEHY